MEGGIWKTARQRWEGLLQDISIDSYENLQKRECRHAYARLFNLKCANKKNRELLPNDFAFFYFHVNRNIFLCERLSSN